LTTKEKWQKVNPIYTAVIPLLNIFNAIRKAWYENHTRNTSDLRQLVDDTFVQIFKSLGCTEKKRLITVCNFYNQEILPDLLELGFPVPEVCPNLKDRKWRLDLLDLTPEKIKLIWEASPRLAFLFLAARFDYSTIGFANHATLLENTGLSSEAFQLLKNAPNSGSFFELITTSNITLEHSEAALLVYEPTLIEKSKSLVYCIQEEKIPNAQYLLTRLDAFPKILLKQDFRAIYLKNSEMAYQVVRLAMNLPIASGEDTLQNIYTQYLASSDATVEDAAMLLYLFRSTMKIEEYALYFNHSFHQDVGPGTKIVQLLKEYKNMNLSEGLVKSLIKQCSATIEKTDLYDFIVAFNHEIEKDDYSHKIENNNYWLWCLQLMQEKNHPDLIEKLIKSPEFKSVMTASIFISTLELVRENSKLMRTTVDFLLTEQYIVPLLNKPNLVKHLLDCGTLSPTWTTSTENGMISLLHFSVWGTAINASFIHLLEAIQQQKPAISSAFYKHCKEQQQILIERLSSGGSLIIDEQSPKIHDLMAIILASGYLKIEDSPKP
jgi:hypothetical protein